MDRPRSLVVLIAVAACTIATAAHASHFRYGHIKWTRVSGNTVEFTVTSAWQCSFPQYQSTRLDFGDGEFSPYPELGLDTELIGSGTDCAGQCYFIYEFTTQHTYDAEGPFLVHFWGGNRIWSLVNAPNGKYRVETTVDLRDGNTGSPTSAVPVIISLPIDPNALFALPVTDPDSDPITCRMATPSESEIPSVATLPSGPLTVTPSCVVQWNTSAGTPGDKFAAQVVMEETHAGHVVKSAVDFIVELCEGTPPTCTASIPSLWVTPPDVASNATLTGVDPDGGNLTFSAFGLPPFCAPTSPVSGPSPLAVDLECTPASVDIGSVWPVTAVFTDNDGLQSFCDFVIRVQGCLRPPPDMVGWWPLDALSTGGMFPDVAAGNDAAKVGTVNISGGNVDNAADLSAAGYLEVPDDPLLDFGTGDFSVDLWVNTVVDLVNDVLVDKTFDNGGTIIGFSLVKFGNSLIFRLSDTTGFTSYTSLSGVVGGWIHMAVTVDRDALITLFINGVPEAFVPAGSPVDIDNTSPLLIGQGNTFQGESAEGPVDEVQVFNRALTVNEVLDLYTAGAYGKCKETCAVPNWQGFWGGATTASIPLTICNYTGSVQSYTFSADGIPGQGGPIGTGCNVDGPTPGDIAYPNGQTVIVDPFDCETIVFTIDLPATMALPNVTSCYKVTVTNQSSGTAFQCQGTLRNFDEICPQPQFQVEPVEVLVGRTRRVSVTLRNDSDEDHIHYRFDAVSSDLDYDNLGPSLDGQAPGVPVVGSAAVPAGQLGIVSVDVDFAAHHPVHFFDLVLSDDETGGRIHGVTSRLLRSSYSDSTLSMVPGTQPPRALDLAQNVPNPFNPSTTIRYTIAAPGRVSLSIHDVTGRVVRTLLNETLSPADVEPVEWDGTDGTGRRVASGVYFYRLVWNGRAVAKKMVLLK